eukprot:NODE_595_length_1513_cov_219.877732_g444_i0.p1 GENE.NODE_595_length_1513_cov_219.877732_g444_i0~~NODE_595_length_1513_cov_219.877732_g444_i0.p1  ORF type:complete len:441 (+),score=108.56 NODE_595_length_1513_cov_219.877732_g444_i0:54-1325(+)
MKLALFFLGLILCTASLVKTASKKDLEAVRRVFPQSIRSDKEAASFLHELHAGNYTEETVEDETKFGAGAWNCQLYRSSTPPTSAHNLKPGDIDLVGVLGDSLSAAFGAKSTNLFFITSWKEYRGISFTGGGDGDVGSVITLPNVLKRANPALKGFSTGTTILDKGPEDVSATKLNQARSGGVADDLPPKTLFGFRGEVANWTTVGNQLYGANNFKNQWKLLTIMIGDNNLCWTCGCSKCNKTRHLADAFEAELTETLDYIKANAPKTFVSIVAPIDPSRVNVLKSGACGSLILPSFCECGVGSTSQRAAVSKATQEYEARLYKLQAMDKYNDANMATVVQPFLQDTFPPEKSNGSPDRSYFAPDCFHFSPKAHAAAATALWDDMISPVDEKPTKWFLGEPLECPTSPNQLLCTTKNKGTGGC